MQDGSKKAIVAAFFANLGIAVAKFVGFLITRSAGLLAEAGHSLADTGNQALLLFGSKRAKRSADRSHPFGYGPERYFWAFVVALVLFSMGGLFALYEGIHKLNDPHELDNVGVAYGILIFAIGLETFSLRTAIVEARRVKPKDKSWWWFIRNAKSPELPVVLLEDTGAEIGLFFALIGLTAADITGNSRWDALGSIAIGILLVVIAIILAVEMKSLIIGEAPDQEMEQAIRHAITDSPKVAHLIHFRAVHHGPENLLVAAKVEFDRSLDLPQLAAAIDEVESAMRSAAPIGQTIYIEPDIRRQMTS